MYSIYADDICIYDDISTLSNLRLLNPKLRLEDNSAGSLSFTMPTTNIGYHSVKKLTTDIIVNKNNKEIWSGRIISESKDFMNNRVIFCEGELAYLNDTIQPPAEYHNKTVREFLATLINIHNSKAKPNRQFKVGAVTVNDPNDSLYRYTNYETTIKCLNEKLVERLGGHLRVRKVNGVRYLDYLSDYPNTNSQTIEFGKNLLDFTRGWDLSDFATVLVPKGARLEDSPIEALDAYLTVSSVNNGSIYVQSPEAIKNYGWIEKVVSWDDVTKPDILLKKAKKYLSEIQFDRMNVTLSAVDLHYLNVNYEDVKLLDNIQVISRPHGMDRYFPVRVLDIPLDRPEETQFTLGDTIKTGFIAENNKVNQKILYDMATMPKPSAILKEAKKNATEIMNMATNGYITITKDQYGTNTLYISDNKDYKKAMKLWKWSLNGLGYSKDGGKTFGLAMTMDGSIVADYITSGSLSADRIRAGVLKDQGSNVIFNLNTGTLRMTKGSISIGGKFRVDESGYLYSILGKIGGFTITDRSIYNNVIELDNNGLSLKRDGVKIGNIGTNYIQNYPSQRGLVMDLDPQGSYIGWASNSNADNAYNLKLTYVNRAIAGFNRSDRLYLGCSLDGSDYNNYRFWFDPATGGASGGITGTMNFVQVKGVSSDGTLSSWVNGCRMEFKHGVLVNATFN